MTPDPLLVRRVYLAHYQQRPRGALARTHRALIKAGYSISDQTIANYVALPKAAKGVRDTARFAKQPSNEAAVRHNEYPFELRAAPRSWCPIANAHAAADVSYVTAVVVTPLLILAMIAAPVLMIGLIPCLIGVWHVASTEQRRIRPVITGGHRRTNDGRT